MTPSLLLFLMIDHMNEKVIVLKEFLEVFNNLRSCGVGRRATVRSVRSGDDGSTRITILFPDMDYLVSVCLALKAWPELAMRIDGLFILITIH